MPDWRAEERALSRRVYRGLMDLGDPRDDWWVSKGILGEKLSIDPDDERLDNVARMLIENGRAETNTSDRWLLRATRRG